MNASRVDAEDLLYVLSESTGPQTRVREGGILYAAAARPEAVILGQRLYGPVAWQAAALLHSIIRWEPLDMWNAGFGWRAVAALVGVQGRELMMAAEDRMTLTEEITSGALDSVEQIGSRLVPFLRANAGGDS
jgi:death-on-curing protein